MNVIEHLENVVKELKKEKDKKKDHKSMGIGKIGGSGIAFNRQYRFLIAGEHLPQDFNKKVHVLISPGNNRLVLTAYDLTETVNGKKTNHALDWSEAMFAGKYPDETLTLMTLDGVGEKTGVTKFSELKLLSVESSYDYATSEEVNLKMTLSFGKYQIESVE